MNSFEYYKLIDSLDDYAEFLEEEVIIKENFLQFLNNDISKNNVEIHREEKILDRLKNRIQRYRIISNSLGFIDSACCDLKYEDLIHPPNVQPLSMKEFKFLFWFSEHYYEVTRESHGAFSILRQ